MRPAHLVGHPDIRVQDDGDSYRVAWDPVRVTVYENLDLALQTAYGQNPAFQPAVFEHLDLPGGDFRVPKALALLATQGLRPEEALRSWPCLKMIGADVMEPRTPVSMRDLYHALEVLAFNHIRLATRVDRMEATLQAMASALRDAARSHHPTERERLVQVMAQSLDRTKGVQEG